MNKTLTPTASSTVTEQATFWYKTEPYLIGVWKVKNQCLLGWGGYVDRQFFATELKAWKSLLERTSAGLVRHERLLAKARRDHARVLKNIKRIKGAKS